MAGGRTRVKQIHARAKFAGSAQRPAWSPLPSRAASRAIADAFNTLLPCSTSRAHGSVPIEIAIWREQGAGRWREKKKVYTSSTPILHQRPYSPSPLRALASRRYSNKDIIINPSSSSSRGESCPWFTQTPAAPLGFMNKKHIHRGALKTPPLRLQSSAVVF